MNDLQKYVEDLFQGQKPTSEIKELKEEILSNMLAKRDDLTAQGMDVESATQKAKEGLAEIDCLLDTSILTNVGRYHEECSQSVLMSCTVFWILSLPLLFTMYAPVTYMAIILIAASGCVYLFRKKRPVEDMAYISVAACKKRKKTAWIIWALFFIAATGTMTAVTFGSNIWFGRPPHIDGPYQWATVALRFYLPVITVIVPLTFSSFVKILIKNREE